MQVTAAYNPSPVYTQITAPADRSSLRVNIELDAGNSREFLYQWPSIKSALKHLAVSQLLPLAEVKLFIKYTRSRDFTTTNQSTVISPLAGVLGLLRRGC